MMFQWNSFSIFVLLPLSGSFTSTKYLLGKEPDVTYEDIKSLNPTYATCDGIDSCKVPRTKDPWKYTCNCDEICSYLGTCCVDSKYRQKYKQKYLKNVQCRQLNNVRDFYYPWIESCNPEIPYDKTTEEFCAIRGIPISDPLVEIPVTDPVTGITYKNYFCFACNEESGEDRLIPWNVAIGGDLEKVNKSFHVPNLRNYEDDFWSWVTDKDNDTHLSIWPTIPEELENVVPFCYAFEVVSECASDWTDENVRKMCLAYMDLTRIFNGTRQSFVGTLYEYRYYRNPHCAICNYENMDNKVCEGTREFHISAPGGLLPSGDFFVRIFSLHDKTFRCRNRLVYDKFTKRCRNIYRAKRKVQQ